MTSKRKDATQKQEIVLSPLARDAPEYSPYTEQKPKSKNKNATGAFYFDLDYPEGPTWKSLLKIVVGVGARLIGFYGFRPASDKPLFEEKDCKVQDWPEAGTLPLVHPVPKRETLQWSGTVGLRYLLTIAFQTPLAWLRARFWEKTSKVSDEEITELFNKTILSTFLNGALDEKDFEIFKNQLPKDYRKDMEEFNKKRQAYKPNPDNDKVKHPVQDSVKGAKAKYYKADYSLQAEVNPQPGTYVTAAVGLFKREGPTDNYPLSIVAISLDNNVFVPEDGDAWEYAKTLLLTGSAYDVLFVEHPSNAHLPMEIVNAYTKTVLPQNHSLYTLLEPHFYLHFGVNDSVRFGYSSIAMMETATPFNCMTFGLPDKAYLPVNLGQGETEALKFFRVGAHGYAPDGVPNSSYKPYKFKLHPKNIESVFGRFLRSFFPVVLDFVTEVLKNLSETDYHVQMWAQRISEKLPGFPSAEEMRNDRSKFIRAVAMIVWLESIEHSTTHHSFGYQLPRAKIPFRVREPIPTSKAAQVDYSKITTTSDRSQSILSWKLFFEDKPVTYLTKVGYKFTDDYQKEAVKKFRTSLQQVGKDWGKDAIIPVNQLAPSVQY